ncbi:MAG: hypothetical protein ACHQIM_22650, partial [Sphingobacteriales bacterium]
VNNIQVLRNPTLFIYSKNYLPDNARESPFKFLEDFQLYLNDNFRLIEKIDDNIMIYKISD